jgi:hypothetical protein
MLFTYVTIPTARIIIIDKESILYFPIISGGLTIQEHSVISINIKKDSILFRQLFSYYCELLRISQFSSGEIFYRDLSSNKRMELFFDSTVHLNVFYRRLQIINELYDDFGLLLNISTIKNPLKILYISSGSQIIDLLGYPKIIEFITDLIKKGIGYFHRNYTIEGKIQRLPQELKILEEFTELIDKLDKAGIETKIPKEKIKIITENFSEKLNLLLLGESSISINGDKISLMGDDIEQYKIESMKYINNST